MRLRRLLAAAGVLLLAACSGSAGTPPRAPQSVTTTAGTAPATDCRVTDKLVPSCGVLWGVATPGTYDNQRAVERQVGRPFNLVYHYHDLVEKLPTETERRQVADGQILHLAIAARTYGQEQSPASYASIASGRYDAQLTAQGKGVATLRVPVFVTFEQEGNQKKKLGVRGNATEWKAAWRHVHDVYTRAGATNAVWVWVMTGDPANFAAAASIWPGNDVVDWISWNVYNQSGCHSGAIRADAYASFEQKLRPFYDWVHRTGPSIGMDPSKPMMISEAGSVLYQREPAKTAGWYDQIPAVLQKYPQIKAIQLWNSKTTASCDYRFERDPEVLRAVAGIGKAGYLDSVPPQRAAR